MQLNVFHETWLQEHIPSSSVSLPGFQTIGTDRNIKRSGKRQWYCSAVNNRWCKSGHINATVKHCFCSPDIELLALSLLSYRHNNTMLDLLEMHTAPLHNQLCARQIIMWFIFPQPVNPSPRDNLWPKGLWGGGHRTLKKLHRHVLILQIGTHCESNGDDISAMTVSCWLY